MNDERLRDLLQSALPPAGDRPGGRDLWPEMRRRMDEGERWRIRLGLFDWAIAILLIACIWISPRLIVALLYQL